MHRFFLKIAGVLLIFSSSHVWAQYDETVGGLNYENGQGTSFGNDANVYDSAYGKQAAIDEANNISASTTTTATNTTTSTSTTGGFSSGEDGSTQSFASNVYESIGTLANPDTYSKFYSSIKSTVTKTAKTVAPITYGAASAGLAELNSQPEGTSELDYERAFYNGANQYYQVQGIDPYANFVPIGPVQRMTATNFNLSDVNSDLHPSEVNAIKTIDELFRKGEVSIHYRGMVSRSQQIGDIINSPTLNLNPVQQFGLKHSIVVMGTSSAVEKIGAGLGNYDAVQMTAFLDTFSGGIVVVPTDIKTLGLDERQIKEHAFRHEILHAGDTAIAIDSAKKAENPKLSIAEREKARQVKIAATLVNFGTVNQALTPEEQREIANINQNFAKDVNAYSNALAEYRAYTQVQNSGLSGFADTIKNEFGMSDSDAAKIAEILENSSAIQSINKTMTGYATNNL